MDKLVTRLLVLLVACWIAVGSAQPVLAISNVEGNSSITPIEYTHRLDIWHHSRFPGYHDTEIELEPDLRSLSRKVLKNYSGLGNSSDSDVILPDAKSHNLALDINPGKIRKFGFTFVGIRQNPPPPSRWP